MEDGDLLLHLYLLMSDVFECVFDVFLVHNQITECACSSFGPGRVFLGYSYKVVWAGVGEAGVSSLLDSVMTVG